MNVHSCYSPYHILENLGLICVIRPRFGSHVAVWLDIESIVTPVTVIESELLHFAISLKIIS